MNVFAKLALAATALAGMGGTAMAADLMAPPPPAAAMTSDWSGPYVGLLGSYWFQSPAYIEATGVLGYNFSPSESFLLGVEGTVGYYSLVGGGSTGFDASIAARAGVIAGPALLYASVGEYDDITGSTTSPFVGLGAEFKVGDSASLRTEALYYTGYAEWEARAGVLWHFH